MEKNLNIRTEEAISQTPLMSRLKRIFNGNKTRTTTPPSQQFGKTVGIVWEYKSEWSGEPIACIVQIERAVAEAKVTIYDGNDPRGTSVTNCIENIASGVYLEHLAADYKPSQVALFHRDTHPLDSEPQWGTKPVSLKWSEDRQCFEYPEWERWQPDFEVPEIEKILVRELRSVAAVAIENWMRGRHERGEVTPRERELYDRYQEHISAKSENYRYNLRGGWIFAPPRSYL